MCFFSPEYPVARLCIEGKQTRLQARDYVIMLCYLHSDQRSMEGMAAWMTIFPYKQLVKSTSMFATASV